MTKPISKTKKSSKKRKKSARPIKKREINWDEFTREELIEIAKQYVEIIDEISEEDAKKD